MLEINNILTSICHQISYLKSWMPEGSDIHISSVKREELSTMNSMAKLSFENENKDIIK